MACAMRPMRVATLAKAPVVAARPAGLASSFVSARPADGMFRSFTGLNISSTRKVSVASPLVVMAGGKSLGCTRDGSNRHSKRVSGFRARMQTPTGRKVLKARRKKGRKTLCPASLRKNGKTRV